MFSHIVSLKRSQRKMPRRTEEHLVPDSDLISFIRMVGLFRNNDSLDCCVPATPATPFHSLAKKKRRSYDPRNCTIQKCWLGWQGSSALRPKPRVSCFLLTWSHAKKSKCSRVLHSPGRREGTHIAETSTRETKHHTQRVGDLRFITPTSPEELTLQALSPEQRGYRVFLHTDRHD